MISNSYGSATSAVGTLPVLTSLPSPDLPYTIVDTAQDGGGLYSDAFEYTLISDVIMPKMGGYNLAAIVKEMYPSGMFGAPQVGGCVIFCIDPIAQEETSSGFTVHLRLI